MKEVQAEVSIGRVGRSKGLKGELCVHPHNVDSCLLFEVSSVRIQKRQFEIENVSDQGGKIVLKLKGITTKDEASGLTNEEMFVRRDELPQLESGEYYCCDLEGLDVEAADGKVLGRLREVMPTASNDVYVVDGPMGEILLPATKDVIVRISLEDRKIVVKAPEVIDAF